MNFMWASGEFIVNDFFLEMSTDLKSDAVNFSKKEKSPEPPPVVS